MLLGGEMSDHELPQVPSAHSYSRIKEIYVELCKFIDLRDSSVS